MREQEEYFQQEHKKSKKPAKGGKGSNSCAVM